MKLNNITAFLDMLAWAEIGPTMLADSDRGYNVLVGSTPGHMKLFYDYSDHPRKLIEVRPGLKSTAAGRYQILRSTFDYFRKKDVVFDFYPASQDIIAVKLLQECGAYNRLSNGDFLGAVLAASSRWASLPGNSYGQPEKRISELVKIYGQNGGVLV